MKTILALTCCALLVACSNDSVFSRKDAGSPNSDAGHAGDGDHAGDSDHPDPHGDGDHAGDGDGVHIIGDGDQAGDGDKGDGDGSAMDAGQPADAGHPTLGDASVSCMAPADCDSYCQAQYPNGLGAFNLLAYGCACQSCYSLDGCDSTQCGAGDSNSACRNCFEHNLATQCPSDWVFQMDCKPGTDCGKYAACLVSCGRCQ